MEKVVWTGFVYPGKMGEYRCRHDRIWPEMQKALRDAGIRNYTIWSSGERLIGYYECESREETEKRKSADPVFGKWKDSMKNIMCLETEQEGLPFEKIFSLEETETKEEPAVEQEK